MSNEVVKAGVECANNTLGFIRRAVNSTCELKEITDVEFIAMSRTLADVILKSVEKLSHLEPRRRVDELSTDPYIITLTMFILEQLASEVNHED